MQRHDDLVKRAKALEYIQSLSHGPDVVYAAETRAAGENAQAPLTFQDIVRCLNANGVSEGLRQEVATEAAKDHVCEERSKELNSEDSNSTSAAGRLSLNDWGVNAFASLEANIGSGSMLAQDASGAVDLPDEDITNMWHAQLFD